MRWLFRVLLFLCLLGSLPAFPQHFDLQRDRMPLTELNGNFRFHPGDDPRWADPAFNDSQWPLLKSNQSWYEQGYKNYSGFAWYRFRITVPEGDHDLAILIPRVQDNFAVYANRRLIGQLGEFPPHATPMIASSHVFRVPRGAVAADRTITFAVRVWRSPRLSGFDGAGFDAAPVVGEADAVARWADLQVHDTFWWTAEAQLQLMVNIAGALVALTLFFLRRGEREYLWYGAAQGFFSIYSASQVAAFFLKMPWLLSEMTTWLGGLAGVILNLVFFHVLLRQRRRILFWVGAIPIGLAMVCSFAAALSLIGLETAHVVNTMAFIPYTFAVVLLIWRAALRGNSEAWLLAGPFTASCLDIVYFTGYQAFDLGTRPGFAAFNHFMNYLITWPIRLGGNILIGESCNVAVCAVLILRFARTRRDEERLAAELESARAVQQVLVPTEVPAVPGFQIESVYKPAGQVGGDFYQIVALEGGGALIAIGDVSGKGMPAAMTVSLLVGTFRTLAHYTHSPAEILAAMNQRMLARSQGGFTTCLVLRLDANGALTLANAGHIAPYVDGREIELTNGLPLGLVPDAEYQETATGLPAGSHLTLLTDGVVEARNPRGELFGFDRARALSTQTADQVANAAQCFGQEDDITVLTVNPAVAVPA